MKTVALVVAIVMFILAAAVKVNFPFIPVGLAIGFLSFLLPENIR